MPQNIKINELLGDDFKEYNYAVTSNWRIDFSGSNEFKKLLEGAPGDDGHPAVLKQLSFACHSDFQFEADVEYAEAERMVNLLNAGALPVPAKRIIVCSISFIIGIVRAPQRLAWPRI